jgi:hypothetical protein
MCTVSSELKFCSCKITDFDNLKYYWVLHRFVEGKDVMVLGEVMINYFEDKIDHKLNEKIILKALNAKNIFDFEPVLNDKDLLHLAFKFGDDFTEHHNYGFEFKNGKWRKTEYDGLMWMWHHEEFKQGKIENVIKINE